MKNATIAFAAVVGTLILATGAMGSPFVIIQMVGSVHGSGDLMSSEVMVNAGDVVDFQLWALMAELGTINTTATPDKVITSLSASPLNGILSARFNLYQEGGAETVVTFRTSELNTVGGWAGGTGAMAGALVQRVGADPGVMDLVDFKAVRAPGVYAGVAPADTPIPVLLGTGTFEVLEVGADSKVLMSYLTPKSQSPGSMKINSTILILSGAADADPYFGFTPLALIPEPATLALLGLGGLVTLLRRRR